MKANDVRNRLDEIAVFAGSRPLEARLAVTLTRLHGGNGPRVVVQLVPTAGQPVPVMVNLTKRQRAVAQEMLAGATIQEAAANLHLSPETVRSHLKAIYLALGVSTRVELTRVLRSEEKSGMPRGRS